jgi:glycine/D-amino acid oxidase-like deaminating enzyme
MAMKDRRDKAIPAEPHPDGAVFHRGRSFWFDSSEPYRPCDPLRDEINADFCVIGGGVTGVSTAYHLKKIEPSASVVLLEAEVVGFGASGRNAGQLVVQFGGGALPDLVAKYGAAKMGAAYDYIHEGVRLIKSLQAEERFDCDYVNSGYLKAALRLEGDEQIERHLRLFERIGQASHYTYLGQHDVERELRSPHLGAALFDHRGGQFNPLKLVRGLKEAAKRRGVHIFENSPVARVERNIPRISVETGSGRVMASRIVLATNAFTHQLQGLADISIGREQTPLIVKGAITEQIEDSRWREIGWPRRCGINVLSQLFYSFAPTIDGRILSVSGYHTSAPSDRSLAPEIETRLKRSGHLAAFFPALRNVGISQTWGGPISITMDWIPHVGRTKDPRIVYGCGCWGNGMALGMHNGRTLAELSLERESAGSSMWFVERRKTAWPNSVLARLLAGHVIRKRRRGNRKLAARMDPPIGFE